MNDSAPDQLQPPKKNFVTILKKILLFPFLALWWILKFPFKVWKFLFGSFNYNPPKWAAKVFRADGKLRQQGARAGAWITAHKKIVRSTLAATVLVCLGWTGWYGYNHWLPHPNWVTVSVQAPTPMNLRLEKPTPNPVVFSFSDSAADMASVGKPLEKGVTLSPTVDGTWIWTSDRELQFTPKAEWPVGQSFTASFEKGLFGRKIVLGSYSADFQSEPFKVTLVGSEFYQHPTLPKEKKGIVSLSFNYPVDPESLSKRVSAELVDIKKNKSDVKFSIQYGPKLIDAHIHSDFLPIPQYDATLKIEVDKGVRSSLGGGGSETAVAAAVAVPGMFNYFKIASAGVQVVRNENFEPEHVLIVATTAGARSEEVGAHLKAYLLPLQNPTRKHHSKIDPWQNIGEISAAVQQQMTPLNLKVIPSEFENSTIHSFKLKSDTGRYIYLKIEKGVHAFGDYVLAGDYNGVTRIPEFPKEVVVMHHGSILSLKGERKIPVLSRNVSDLQFTARRLRPTDLHHFITQSSGNFQDPEFVNRWQFGEEDVSETFTETRKVDNTDPTKTQYHSFDFTKYLNTGTTGARGVFFFTAQEWNPKTKSVMGQPSKRFIVVTDLGVILKQNVSGDMQAYVQSFSSGLPVSGGHVEVLARNGTTLFSENTDGNGRASFPSLQGFTNEKTPVAITVKHGDDYTFLPLNHYDRNLNFARFDVGGVESTSEADRILAFAFTDRGIFRPGDTARIGVITKALSWKPLPEGMPLEFVVVDPRGSEIYKEKFSVGKDGLDEFSYTSTEESPTGTYQAQVHVIKNGRRAEMLGSVNFKIEEFLPDRMKILVTLSKQSEKGWIQADSLKAKILLTNLFGTPAQNRKISSDFRLIPGFPSTRAYADYIFLDAKRSDKSYSEHLEDVQTDDKGEAQVDINLKKFDAASYRLEYVAQGFEPEGGRSVSASSSVYISPLNYVVGYKADGDMSYLKIGTPRKLQFIALNPEMKKTAVKGLKAQVIEYKYVSVLTQQSNGTYKYQSVKKEVPVGDPKDIAISEKGLSWTVDTAKGGSYSLVVKDQSGLEFAKVPYSVIAPTGLSRGLDRNAELQLSLNKSDYKKGEAIELQIRAPYTGAGLITIEREKVISSKWFKTNTETSLQRITVPESLEGNAYVSVAFVRSLDSREIYTSPLSYAVAPFTVSKDNRKTNITLKVPEIVRPGDKMNIKYSSSRPTSLVLYGVDEGILQVASYKLPDPLAFFFTKRALQVKTSQILDLLLPEFSVFQSLSAAGGDEGSAAVAANLNPFKRRREKPVAFWSGVIPASSKESTFTYEVPDYFNGSLRVMAVASAAGAVGNGMTSSTVRGDFVLSPNVPTFVAPGDTFEVSVGVSNTAVGSQEAKEVNLTLETSEHLEVVGDAKRKLDIREGSEKSEKFKIKAKDILGSGSFKFAVEWKGKKARSTVDLSVRPPVPYMTDLRMGLLKDSSLDLPITRPMYSQFRKLDVSASILPLSLADGLMTYLDEYPYGCTEQIVSKGFPALVLGSRPDFKVSPEKVQKNFERVVNTLRLRETPRGGFGLWNAVEESYDFPSLYAIHYLTEAKEKGFTAGNDLLERGVSYLSSGALDKAETLHEARLWAYSLYLRARNAVVPTQSLQNLRGILDSRYKNDWTSDLTGIYLAGTYALLQQQEEGLKLMKSYKSSIKGLFDWNFFYDKTIRESQYLYIMGRHYPALLKDLKAEDLVAMLEPLMKGWYTTTNSSYAILGLDAFAKGSEQTGETTLKNVQLFEKWKGGQRTLDIPGGLFPKVAFTEKAEKIGIQNPNSANVFYQLTEAGFDHNLPQKDIQEGIEIQRTYMNLDQKEVTKAKNGEELWVRLRARSLGKGYVNNVAVVDLLPGGFEVVLDSIRKPQVAESTPIMSAPYENSGSYQGDEGGGYQGDEGGGEGEAPPPAEGDGDARFDIFRKVFQALGPTEAFAQRHRKIAHQTPAQMPAGAIVRTPSGAGPANTFSLRSTDVREDRVVIFGTIKPDMGEYFYKIKAINAGSYVVPPPFAESMYDKTLKARGLPSKIEVEP